MKLFKRLDKSRIAGVISVILLFLSIVFAIETPYNRPIGDSIIEALGLKSWSNGYQGFHYTVIYSILLFILGLVGTNLFLKEKYPKFIKKLPVFLLILLIAYPLIASTVVGVIKSNSAGLYAIHYMKKRSEVNYETSKNDDVITIEGNLRFRNYSNKELKFYIKYINNGDFLDELSLDNEKEMVAVHPETNGPKLFTIPPKTSISLKAIFKIKKKEDISGKGHYKGPDIIIFNDKKEIKFIQSNI